MKSEVPNELLKAIARGNCVAFVGSGPSLAAGFPSWPRLLKLIVKWCKAQGITLPNQSDIEHLIDTEKYLIAAQALRTKMGDDQYFRFLRETFDKPTVPLPEFHQLLAQIPFGAAGTTNYETLVERAVSESKPGEAISVFSQTDYAQLGTALNSNDYFVLKAHGTIERPETIVLTDKDYATLIHNSSGYRTFLKALFLDRTVLFLGFGLNDPELRLLLEELREIFDGHTPLHYALLDVNGTTGTEQANFELHYGVRIIPYTPAASDHPEVIEFLRQILSKLPKYILHHTMNKAMAPAKVVLESDSHYKWVADSEGKFHLREKFEGASKEKPLKITTELRFDTKNPEGREAYDAFKRFQATGEPITIKSPHLAKVIPPEVFSLLMPDHIDEMQVSMGPVVGQKLLAARAVFETNDGEKVVLENIEFKNIQSGTEQMILSNEHQTVPWKFRQVIRFNERESEANFTFESVGMPIAQAVRGLKFCKALSKGGSLRIESVETEMQLAHAKIAPGAYPCPSQNWMRICEVLELIQRKTGTLFKAPETVSPEEAREISTVEQIITTGKGTMLPPTFDATSDEAKTFLAKSSAEKPICLMNYADGWVSVIFGKHIALGPVLITGEQLYITADDAEVIRRQIGDGNGSIPLRLSPVEGTVIEAKYPRWLPQEEAEAVLNVTFVRKTALKNLINSLFDAASENGDFSAEEFIELLRLAREASLDEELLINPLKTESFEEISEAIGAHIRSLGDETRRKVAEALIVEGWLRPESVAPTHNSAAATP